MKVLRSLEKNLLANLAKNSKSNEESSDRSYNPLKNAAVAVTIVCLSVAIWASSSAIFLAASSASWRRYSPRIISALATPHPVQRCAPPGALPYDTPFVPIPARTRRMRDFLRL